MTREYAHPLNVAHPIYETPGIASGSFTFPDAYLRPQVNYLNFPPTTEITIGGRIIEIPNQVSVKCRLLDPDEDRLLWNKKVQHKHRVNLGDHHRDFGDVEVSYSHTTPRTHIWFAGYAIHVETAEILSVLSYNATLRISPDDILPPETGGPGPSFAIGSGMELQRIRKRVRKANHPRDQTHQRHSKSYSGYRPLDQPVPPERPHVPLGPAEIRARRAAPSPAAWGRDAPPLGVMGAAPGADFFNALPPEVLHLTPTTGYNTTPTTGYNTTSPATGYNARYESRLPAYGTTGLRSTPLAAGTAPMAPIETKKKTKTALPGFPINSGFAGPNQVQHLDYSHELTARPNMTFNMPKAGFA